MLAQCSVAQPVGGFALLGSVSVDARGHGVSALAFDPFEDLLWTGTTAGRLVSYYGGGLGKYTAFQSVPAAEPAVSHAPVDVRCILPVESGVLSLSSKLLKCNKRQGLNRFAYSCANMVDLCCVHRPLHNSRSNGHHVILGGRQSTIIELNLETRKQVRLATLADTVPDCVLMKSNSRFLFCADTSGQLTLRSFGSLDVAHTLQAHQGPVSDFDICSNRMVTCGFSPRMGHLSADRHLMLYDLRTLKPLPPIPLHFDPCFVRFLPVYSDSRLVVASQLGEFQVFDIGQQMSGFPYQVDTQGSTVFSMDISPSMQCIAFGDGAGCVNLFSDRAQAVFNEHAWPTEFADPLIPIPTIPFDDHLAPLAIVPLPFATDGTYCSDLPQEMCRRVHRVPNAVPDEVLQSMKQVQFVGYAKNPHPGLKRNIVPYSLNTSSQTTAPAGLSDSVTQSPLKPTAPTIPKFYRRVHVRPSRFMGGSDEFDYRRYNKTELVPIESNVPSDYCATVLLALYHIECFRRLVMCHLCRDEYCLSCEVCFLYRMLADRTAEHPASVTNFLRALRTFSTANELGLLISEDADAPDFAAKVRSFAHFLSEHLGKELTIRHALPPGRIGGGSAGKSDKESDFEGPSTVNPIGAMCEIEFTNYIRCIRCESSWTAKQTNLLVKLNPSATSGERVKFGVLLERSLNLKHRVNGDCETCEKETALQQNRRVNRMPSVLVVDANVSGEKEREFWTKQQANFERCSRDRAKKPCRYGDECRKVYCRYAHSERRDFLIHLTSVGDSVDDGGSALSDDPSSRDDETQHYILGSFGVKIRDGLCAVEEIASQDEECLSQFTCCYTLKAIVSSVRDFVTDEHPHLSASIDNTTTTDDDKSAAVKQHLVVAVRTALDAHNKDGWAVFNEFVVTKVSADEALQLDLSWKTPCLFYYVKDWPPSTNNGANDEASCSVEEVAQKARQSVDESVFFTDECLAVRRRLSNSTFTVLDEQEIPAAGDLVALDAEFVSLNADGAKSSHIADSKSQRTVARVSCIRGSGEKEGIPFLDDFIVTKDKVHDYLTKFSGINAEDLIPSESTKHLTTLKAMYLKLLYMVDRGVKFVGHGLYNDFRVINIYVPPDQVIDTVRLFHLPHQRMVSLRFLAWHLLDIRIQADSHDSIEDARTALKVYRKYLDMKEKGQRELDKYLNKLYEAGKECQWKVPDITTAADESSD